LDQGVIHAEPFRVGVWHLKVVLQVLRPPDERVPKGLDESGIPLYLLICKICDPAFRIDRGSVTRLMVLDGNQVRISRGYAHWDETVRGVSGCGVFRKLALIGNGKGGLSRNRLNNV
jgi:hypothetical protein